MIDSARGTIAVGTSRIAVAVAIVQKPPSAMPSTTRPISSVVRFGANATARFDATSSTENTSSTRRRSMVRVSAEISRLVTSATVAVAVTAWPATPSVTPRLSAIGVSRLAGRNSAVTRPNTPSVIAKTAPHAGSRGAAGAAAEEIPGFMRRSESSGESTDVDLS